MTDLSELAYLPYPATYQGYGHTHKKTHRTNMTRGGRPRQRRIAARGTLRVRASWTLVPETYALFVGFYEHATAHALPFAVDAIAEGDTSRCLAHFIPGSLRQEGITGGSYKVSAELDVVPNLMDPSHDVSIVELFELYGTGMAGVIASLDRLVNVVMPEEIS